MTSYRGRSAATIENGALRVTVLEEGGHIAEITDLDSGVNPLWTPHWPSMEPSRYDPARDAIYGGGADGSLLAGIMGHNLCLDIFGGPSSEEAAAGMPVHGETSTARFDIDSANGVLSMETLLPSAQLRVSRRVADRIGSKCRLQTGDDAKPPRSLCRGDGLPASARPGSVRRRGTVRQGRIESIGDTP